MVANGLLAQGVCVQPGMPRKLITASCGLTAFAIAVIAGLASSNPADVVLLRALIAMAGFTAVGAIVGGAMESTFDRSLAEARTQDHVAAMSVSNQSSTLEV
jgi:hypothetical protein